MKTQITLVLIRPNSAQALGEYSTTKSTPPLEPRIEFIPAFLGLLAPSTLIG